ncbi:hypothetical protein SFC66_13140 [Terribacillus saccharophilus]|uniref:hypothetical protein n=1 Tax=Terribacillus saccharophilus TaxID=361277 RepID=UPI003981E15F
MSKKGILIGFTFSFLAAVLCAIAFTVIAVLPFIVTLEPIAFLFVFVQCIVPFFLIFPLVGGWSRQIRLSSQLIKWLISCGMAIIVVMYAGTLGSLSSHTLVFGNSIEELNVDGILVWGMAYPFILLPLTAPLAWGILHWFLNICFQYDTCRAE